MGLKLKWHTASRTRTRYFGTSVGIGSPFNIQPPSKPTERLRREMKQEAEQREKARDEAMEKAFEAGRNSVVFNPHSDYRNALRELIVDGDFDFTKIFCEVEYEGETYADLSEDGADALTDYFLGLMEVIDERRSEDAEFRPGLAAAREGGVDEFEKYARDFLSDATEHRYSFEQWIEIVDGYFDMKQGKF
jgi:hypothetical protein